MLISSKSSSVTSQTRALFGAWSRSPGILCVALLLTAFVARLTYGYELDELMHLHTAWNIGQGLLPYRDFYENHLPLFHMLLSPAVASLTDATFPVLIACRIGSLIIAALCLLRFSRLIVWVTGTMHIQDSRAQRVAFWRTTLRNPFLGATYWGAVALLLVHPFYTYGMELRPDWLTLTCLLGALVLLLQAMQPQQLRVGITAVQAGLLAGTGICMTQKATVLLIGVTGWLLATCILTSERDLRRQRILCLCLFVSGMLLPLIGLILYFARFHSAGLLYEYVLAVNTRWGQEAPFLAGAQEGLMASFPLFALGFARVLRIGSQWRAQLQNADPQSLAAVILIIGVAGFLKAPVPNGQWFLFLVAPWGVLLGVVSLFEYAENLEKVAEDRRRLIGGATICLAAMLPRGWYNAVLVAVVWGFILRIVWRKMQRMQKSDRATLAIRSALSISAIVFAGRIIYELQSGNAQAQNRFVKVLASHLGPQDAVLSPWPNMAPFRPNATYHWFVTGGIYQTLNVYALEQEYTDAIKTKRTPVVVVRPQDAQKFMPRYASYLRKHGIIVYEAKLNLRQVEIIKPSERNNEKQ